MTNMMWNEGQREYKEREKKSLYITPTCLAFSQGKTRWTSRIRISNISVSPAGMAPLHLTDVLDGQSPVDAMRRLMGRCGCSHPLWDV